MRQIIPVALALAGAACTNSPAAPGPPSSVFVTSTFQRGSTLFLQNATSRDTFRIGLDTAWGGSIVELSRNGTNVVNAHDPGREVQIAFYDGNSHYDLCAGCSGVFGWNPVQAGDTHKHGAATLTYTRSPASLYTKVQPLEWYPDNKGGGPTQPVMSDVLIAQTVTPVAGHAAAFHVHWVLTHLGADLHANAHEEVPAVYANAQYDRFVRYAGGAPWTNAPVTFARFPHVGASGTPLHTTEPWGAYVNAQNEGLTVYAPSQLPYTVGFYNPGPDGSTGDGTNYFSPFTTLTIEPGSVKEGDYFVIGGDYEAARQVVYALHQAGGDPDIATPFGSINAPMDGSTIGGVITVIGWALDNASVANVQITVDGTLEGTATYGVPRPDVSTALPDAPIDIGFTYSLNTAHYPNGAHVLGVRATDSAGNVATFPSVRILILN